MQAKLIQADTRGYADHGWLQSHHSFSFAKYSDPERTQFGLLRVLNDDTVAGGKGFGAHPHENMEIISIPLKGSLNHRDSIGSERIIRENDVQVMSAGTGVSHSEYNADADDPVHFLQIWIFPKTRNITPRYDQKTYTPGGRENKWQRIVSPLSDSADTVKINQDAFLHLGTATARQKLTYKTLHEGNGLYAFVLEGSILLAGKKMGRRDAMEITDFVEFEIEAVEKSDILLIEIPLQ